MSCETSDVKCGQVLRQSSGQALVEFVVALVVVMVLLAGIIQISWLGVRHSRAMGEARRLAGQKSMLDVSSFSSPRYIESCTTGPDGVAFSRDDDIVAGDVSGLTEVIAETAHPDDLEGVIPDNSVSVLSRSDMPQALFGLVDGEKKDRVALIPVVRELIYRADEVEVRGSAWMTWTKGIY